VAGLLVRGRAVRVWVVRLGLGVGRLVRVGGGGGGGTWGRWGVGGGWGGEGVGEGGKNSSVRASA